MIQMIEEHVELIDLIERLHKVCLTILWVFDP